MMKPKQMATHLEDRPPVAVAMEAIILATLPKRICKHEAMDPTMTNPFIQLLPKNKSQVSNLLPPEIRRTLSTARKYRLSIDSPTPIPEIKTEMLAWNHIRRHSTVPSTEHRKSGKCLRKNHKCVSVRDLMAQASHRENPQHTPSNRTCPCTNCVHLRHQGCKYPETCYHSAENLLTSLSPRFDLYDDLTPTPNPMELDKSKLCQYVIRNPDEVLIFNFPKQLPHDT